MKKQAIRAVGLIAAGLMLVILTGCRTKISGLQADPSFTYSAAVSDHIAIGGVVSAVSPLSPGDVATYSNQLRTQLSEKRPGFVLIPYGVVVNELGPEDHARLLNELETAGIPSTPSIRVLKQRASGYRYIAFSRIEGDSIQKSLRDAGNNTVLSATSRHVVGSLQIVDLTDGNVVWLATAKTELANVSPWPQTVIKAAPAETSTSSFRQALRETTRERFLGPKTEAEREYRYPSEPALIKVLEELFKGFSANMPEK